MAAGEEDYDGISYADLVFAGVGWSLVDGEEHRVRRDGSRRAEGHTSWRPVVGGDGVEGQVRRDQELRGGPMSENIKEVLGREAVEAEARADAEERGEVAPARGQRGRRRAHDPSQVYAIRIPVSRLRELRELADRLQVPPSALLRQWVLERLDADATSHEAGAESDPSATIRRSIRLGPSRRRAVDIGRMGQHA